MFWALVRPFERVQGPFWRFCCLVLANRRVFEAVLATSEFMTRITWRLKRRSPCIQDSAQVLIKRITHTSFDRVLLVWERQGAPKWGGRSLNVAMSF